MPPNTFQPVSYTIEKITFDERGKKKLCWQPPKWQQITKATMKKYNKPSHKGKCIITGKKSGFTAIDCDTEQAYADIIHDYPELKEAYTVKTPRGFHIYVAYEPLVKTCTTNLDIDVRNDGGCVIAPPSVCSDDSQYVIYHDGPVDIKCPNGLWEILFGEDWDKPPEPEPTAHERIKNLSCLGDKELKLHLENISKKDLTNYSSWRDIGWATLDAAEDKEEMWKVFGNVSKACDNFSVDGLDNLKKNYKPGHFTAGTIKYFSRKGDKVKYNKILMAGKPRIWGNHLDAAADFLQLRQGTMFMYKEDIYVYENEEWHKEKNKNSIVMRVMVRELMDFYLITEQEAWEEVNEYEFGSDDWKEAQARYSYIKGQRNQLGNYNPSLHIYKRLREIMTNDDEILFDTDPKQHYWLHYKNGKLNLQNGEFCKRDINDLITQRLDYNYHDKVPDDVYKEVETAIKKFEPNDRDRKFLLEWLYYNLTGDTRSQKFLHLYGPLSSNGKSNLMKMMACAFGCYVKKVDKRMFEAGSSSVKDKFLESLDNDTPRMIYVEELGSTKIDSDMMKDIVDGDEVRYKKMYSDTRIIDILCKITNLSNQEPNMEVDDAIKRRCMIFECKSQFLDQNSMIAPDDWDFEDDWDRRLFKIDTSIGEKMKKDMYKLAFIKLLLNYPVKRVSMPDSVKQQTSKAMDELDNFKTSLLEFYEITKNPEDKVAKDHIRGIFENDKGKLPMSATQFNRRLKTYGIGWEKNCSIPNQSSRGAYTGLVEKTDE